MSYVLYMDGKVKYSIWTDELNTVYGRMSTWTSMTLYRKYLARFVNFLKFKHHTLRNTEYLCKQILGAAFGDMD